MPTEDREALPPSPLLRTHQSGEAPAASRGFEIQAVACPIAGRKWQCQQFGIGNHAQPRQGQAPALRPHGVEAHGIWGVCGEHRGAGGAEGCAGGDLCGAGTSGPAVPAHLALGEGQRCHRGQSALSEGRHHLWQTPTRSAEGDRRLPRNLEGE